MMHSIRAIVGKTISGVIVKESSRTPRTQVFLLFSDDTYFELYSYSPKSDGRIDCASCLDDGGAEEVRKYCADTHDIVIEPLADPQV